MPAFFDEIRDLTFLTACLRLVLAVVCGGAIGFGRERQGRAAGLRTHVLVCLGSAMTALIGVFAVQTLRLDTDPLRIAAQVVSGIGFLGVGTILVTGKFHVTGLTTAAGLWTTAAIGLALGTGYLEGAVVCTLLALLATMLLSKLEEQMLRHPRRLLLYAELHSTQCVTALRCFLQTELSLHALNITPPRSGTVGNVGAEIDLNLRSEQPVGQLIRMLEDLEYVVFVIETK